MKIKIYESDPFQVFITGVKGQDGYDLLAQTEVEVDPYTLQWIENTLNEYEKVQAYLRKRLIETLPLSIRSLRRAYEDEESL